MWSKLQRTLGCLTLGDRQACGVFLSLGEVPNVSMNIVHTKILVHVVVYCQNSGKMH